MQNLRWLILFVLLLGCADASKRLEMIDDELLSGVW